MSDQPINPKTTNSLKAYMASPVQALGLIGEQWLNKSLIAKSIAEEVLEIPSGSLDSYPYKMIIGDSDASSISIDDIRAINSFLILKVPTNKPTNRVVIIEHGEKMTLEAENALLKNLEEPPSATLFILTAISASALLPTITSRMHLINVYKPAKEKLVNYYKDSGYEAKDIDQAFLLADGLPGLMDQLLTSSDNPFKEATVTAKQLLTATTLDRLSIINDLAKNKAELKNTLFVIKQMAKIGVASNEVKSALKWQKILSATLKSEHRLSSNVQVKLLLTDYVLSLG